jgi:proline dehydrogenase
MHQMRLQKNHNLGKLSKRLLPKQIVNSFQFSTQNDNESKRSISSLDFSDGKIVYAKKSTLEIIRALVVLRISGIKPIVDHAPSLLHIGEKVLGRRFIKNILKATFFGHFCAGETQEGIRPTVKKLETAGVGSMID